MTMTSTKNETNCSNLELTKIQFNKKIQGYNCGKFARAVTSLTRDLRYESNHLRNYLQFSVISKLIVTRPETDGQSKTEVIAANNYAASLLHIFPSEDTF